MIGFLTAIFGELTILGALMNFAVAKSAMHETTAAVMWVGGWLMLAAGAALIRLARLDEPFTVVPGPRPKSEEDAAQ